MNKQNCLNYLKARLASGGKTKTLDKDGNVVYIDTNIYSDDALNAFLDLSLSNFNQIPKFTHFSYNDAKFVTLFLDILTEGAMLYALSSQALLERGREVKIENDGVTYDPPNVSQLLETQYEVLLHAYGDKLYMIKQDIDTLELK